MSGKRRSVLWLTLVYVFSTGCYLSGLLGKWGFDFLDGLTFLSNGFVLIPAIISFLFLLHSHGLKAYFTENLKTITRREVFICLAVAALGACCTVGYSLVVGKNLFQESFPHVGLFLIRGCYLFITAFAEEVAWRGFFLQRLAEGKKYRNAMLLGGVAWAFWHIPMWTVHGLPASQQIQLLIWAVLVSFVLGTMYLRYRNILSSALCHMIFNLCFLASVGTNCAILFCVLVICGLIQDRVGA